MNVNTAPHVVVDCTGERYHGQFQSLAAIDGWHGKFGHFNVLTRDHDSVVTGYGKHDRVATTLPMFDEALGELSLYVRVDTVWGLGLPSVKQILNVARKHDGTKGRWVVARCEQSDNQVNGKPCYHVTFVKAGSKHAASKLDLW
ncbi:hypothetical protein [Alteromonas australica]|uniref:hypothetical protein n=1 Tax=Alteromonas australica TaxID=589873 RepID=UPI00249391B5|nr:hypothetical protein [Alteromonas australica]|tara:strand:- start:71 stop:502 length:432 start_codon:yes stop_codon:yes gene_type:complete